MLHSIKIFEDYYAQIAGSIFKFFSSSLSATVTPPLFCEFFTPLAHPSFLSLQMICVELILRFFFFFNGSFTLVFLPPTFCLAGAPVYGTFQLLSTFVSVLPFSSFHSSFKILLSVLIFIFLAALVVSDRCMPIFFSFSIALAWRTAYKIHSLLACVFFCSWILHSWFDSRIVETSSSLDETLELMHRLCFWLPWPFSSNPLPLLWYGLFRNHLI